MSTGIVMPRLVATPTKGALKQSWLTGMALWEGITHTLYTCRVAVLRSLDFLSVPPDDASTAYGRWRTNVHTGNRPPVASGFDSIFFFDVYLTATVNFRLCIHSSRSIAVTDGRALTTRMFYLPLSHNPKLLKHMWSCACHLPVLSL